MRLGIFALLCAGLLCATPLTSVDEAGFQKLIAAHKGKVLLVDFWATYCTPCRAEIPELVKLEARLRSKGFQLITVSADEPEQQAQAEKFITQLGAPAPAYIRKAKDDDAFINSIDPKWSGALPALFLYDRNGRKVKSFIGETPTKEIEAAATKLL